MSVLYTPLHVHSSRGSLLDSTNTPESLVGKAKEYGLTSLSLTDHGTISNHVEFYKQCKENDIKPILGMEGYIANDMTIQDREQGFFHIVLLAKNKQGYRNLLKLTSIAQLEGFYYKPRIDLKTIKEKGLGKGIIASSACFVKGTEVLTRHGFKEIQNIKQDDCVLNRFGEWERVNFPTTRLYKGDGYVVKNVGDYREIKCTKDHKFLVVDQKNLTPRWETIDFIKNAKTKRFMLFPSKARYNICKDSIKRCEWERSIIKNTDNLRYRLPDNIKITPDLMRLFGIFLGDGSISITEKNKRICFTLNSDEYEYLKPTIENVEEELGIKFSVVTRLQRHRVDLSSASVEMVNLFYYLFGNCVASTKKVPERLKDISYELNMELMFGLIITDGYARMRKKDGYDYGEVSLCSISRQLIYDVQGIMANIGVRSNVTTMQEHTDKRHVRHKRSYYLTSNSIYVGKINKKKYYNHFEVLEIFYNHALTKTARTVEYNGVKYLKIGIRNIEKVNLNEPVFCLNNDTHSFVVNNCIVHNCLGGQAPQMVLNDNSKEDIVKAIQEYQSCFDEFYLELQGTSFDVDEQSEKQFKVNEALYRLSNELDIPLVVTSDSHFTNKEDYQLHNVFIQISQNRDNEVYKDCWLKSPQEMLEQNYGNIPQEIIAKAMQNTMDIADKCTVELELGHGYVPTAKLPSGFSNVESYFSKLVVDGCKKRGFDKFIGGKKKIYWDRIKEEYHVMKEKGFLHYFILLYDILNEARKRGLVTSPSARGSGASSLICYALGITNVDPIKHGLIFERFLTIEKKGLPD